MIASPYATYTADRGHGEPIGTPYEVTNPAGLAYWAPDEWIEESTSIRRAMACRWSPPIPRVQGPEPTPDPSLNLFEQMFGKGAE